MKKLAVTFYLSFGILPFVGAQDSAQVFSLTNSVMNDNVDNVSLSPESEFTLDSLEKNTSKMFQDQLAVSTSIQIEDYSFGGVSVLLEGKQKSIEKAWKHYLRTTSGIKIKEKKGKNFLNRKKINYWKATEVKLLNVTPLAGDIITTYQRENGSVKMSVVYKLGYNASINEFNYAAENERLKSFINSFSQLNFQEYYGDHIKHLKHSLKMVDKELTKESRELKRLEKSYNRSYTKKGKSDELLKLNIDVQRKLVDTLRKEKNQYYLFILQYKSKNSDIRIDTINSTYNK